MTSNPTTVHEALHSKSPTRPSNRSTRCDRSNIWRNGSTNGRCHEPSASLTRMLQVSIIAAFEPEDRLALLEELGNAKESDFDNVDMRAVPAELEEMVDGEGFQDDQA
ncbi:hypothetical protein ACEPAI_8650 [Sanghuangporus weigelae]